MLMDGEGYRPLADRMRPAGVGDLVGQEAVLAPGKPLREAIDRGRLHSMVLWGPPGCGKTTLARIAAVAADAEFLSLSAVLGGVADIRKAVQTAREHRDQGRSTVLFVDEVHRFNKAQQDAFLPHVESGLLVFIGATTENPSFEVNSALLSRVKVYPLAPLTPEALGAVLSRALEEDEALSARGLAVEPGTLSLIAEAADGDGRRALNGLELAADLAGEGPLTEAHAREAASGGLRRFDKGGDAFYDQISALHKSVRSSNPDAALYWYCRMLDGGCDPHYLARRVLRMASEDIGNADPRALQVALQAWQAFERLGSPEGELAVAQAICYLAVAPKSNAVYQAYKAARKSVESGGSLPVPLPMRNAPTALMKAQGNARGYQYDHDLPEGIAFDQQCFPEALGERVFYQPVDRGLEARIGERLAAIRERRRGSGQ